MSFKPRRVFASSFVMITGTLAISAPSAPERHWKIEKHGDTCQSTEVGVKKPAQPYPCIDGYDEKELKIVRHADSTECFVERGPICSHCNPPPPEKVRCPKP